jgi:hypothetical protein
MRGKLLDVAVGTAVLTGCFVLPALSADQNARLVAETPVRQLVIAAPCRHVWVCGWYGCGWRHICRSTCPDRYSCYSLYGRYGPYGGTLYWGAYTAAGWGYR